MERFRYSENERLAPLYEGVLGELAIQTRRQLYQNHYDFKAFQPRRRCIWWRLAI
jgi:hypothetical protein